MSVESFARPDHTAELQAAHSAGFLALGGSPPLVPDPGIWSEPGADFSAIILLGQVEPAGLREALETARDPAVPIADFGNNPGLRHDFASPAFGPDIVAELKHSFAPIWRRLAEIPFRREHQNVAELMLLRLAYSRNMPMTARFDPASHDLVAYPMLGAAPGLRHQLEMLARLELLQRHHFARLHSCTKCSSSRLHVYESCPECDSANLNEDVLVHHYRCGCQQAESSFRKGDLLICPKCERTLHHLGVDYGKPGKVAICAACGTASSDPSVRFVCLDCSTVMASDDAAPVDWYHYELAEEGIRALQQGRLPQFDIAPLLEHRTRVYSPHEFGLLAMHELRVSQRLNRPFSVARVTVLNLEQLIQQKGAVAVDAGFQRVADAVVGELRSSDFVGIGAGRSAVIGFPNTPARDIEALERRIQRIIGGATAARVELGIEIAEGMAIVEMLSREAGDGRILSP